MSIRDHRNPYLRKSVAPVRKTEPSRKRKESDNRAALVRELRSLVRTSLED